MNKDNKFVRSLIQSALQGNNSALEQLFNMNLAKVYTLALRLTSNFKSADLLTETVLVEGWKQLSFLREDATFGSWISSITVYQSLKYLRENENPQHIDAQHLPSKSPLEKMILSLPKNERIAFILHHFEKYTIDEVADLLAIPSSEAQTLISDGEQNIISKTPDTITEESLLSRISLIKVDISPINDVVKQAFVQIYKLKSESEVKEKYLSEKGSESGSQKSGDDFEKKGFASLFKKRKPKSK